MLDVGSGIGGAAFHLAKNYGAKVIGIDLAEEMVAVAHERAGQFETDGSVKFLLGDVLEEKFAEPFDIVWSRDALCMHIPDGRVGLFFTALRAPWWPRAAGW